MTYDTVHVAITETLKQARRAIDQHGVSEAAMRDIQAALHRLAQIPGLKDHATLQELHRSGAAATVLASEGRDGLTLVYARFPPEAPTPVHDHSTWGVAYVVAGALVILGANRLVHAAHDLNSMVFGNAVAVPFADVLVLAVVAVVSVAIHVVFRKEIVFASFDRETAQAMGLDGRLWSGLLFFTIGLAIPVSARALGALPVFAFLTIPAAAALLLTSRLRPAFALASALGLVAAGGGYVISWFWQIPTGPTMVALAAVFAVPGALMRLGSGA